MQDCWKLLENIISFRKTDLLRINLKEVISRWFCKTGDTPTNRCPHGLDMSSWPQHTLITTGWWAPLKHEKKACVCVEHTNNWPQVHYWTVGQVNFGEERLMEKEKTSFFFNFGPTKARQKIVHITGTVVVPWPVTGPSCDIKPGDKEEQQDIWLQMQTRFLKITAVERITQLKTYPL